MFDLEFKKVLNYYIRLYGDTDYAFKEAAESHSLEVFDKLNECLTNMQNLLGVISNEDSKKHLAYGAFRRILMVLHSYSSIRNICHLERTKPLLPEEQRIVDQDINLVYINIRGIMDNLAWSFLYEKDSQILTELELEVYRMRVSLFSKYILRSSTKNFWKIINENHKEWSVEFAKKRDPIAHGLPMYVVPKFFKDDDQAKESSTMFTKSVDALLDKNFDLADELRLYSHNLGIFIPMFASDPTEKLMSIYPIISEDISHIVRILECFAIEIKGE